MYDQEANSGNGIIFKILHQRKKDRRMEKKEFKKSEEKRNNALLFILS